MSSIAAAENRHVVTLDVPGAYLNASMEDREVHMRIDGYLAELLILLEPSYQEYRNSDGSVIVRLDKALYGCKESALLWYKTLANVLEKYGMRKCPYDMCLFCKDLSDGLQLTVGVYVDDLKTTCAKREGIDDLIYYLKVHFGEITVHEGKVHSYLGMVFDYTLQGKCFVQMHAYTADILESSNVIGTAVTPAADNLFKEDPLAVSLPQDDADAFRSMVMKLMFSAKRARPDILTAISYLSSKVSQPNSDHNAKLTRVLKYLNGHPKLGVVLEKPVRLSYGLYGCKLRRSQ
jgi:hypothetical protein